jgi:hypothetical protein
LQTLFFGSIGTLAETSSVQIDAFNQAFGQSGLDCRWSVNRHKEMLADAGGANRIASYARSKGVEVDVGALHKKYPRFSTICSRPAE